MSVNHGSTRFGGALASVVAVCAVLLLGVGTGNLVSVAAGVVGSVCIALGANGMQSKQNERRAAGSLAIVGGAIALTATTGLGTPPLFSLLLGLGMTAVLLNARVDLSSSVGYPVYLMLRRSTAVLVVGTALAVCIHGGLFRTLGGLGGLVIVNAATSSTLAMIIALQIGCLAAVELLHWVVPILDDWLPAKARLRQRILEPFGFRLETVPVAYWAFLAIQIIVVYSGWGPRWFARLLASLSVLGDVIRLVFGSGVLQAVVAAIILFELVLLAARGAQHVIIAWMGDEPPQTLAFAAGGIGGVALAGLVGAVSTFVPSVGSTLATIEPWGMVEQLGPATVIAGSVAGVLILLVLVQVFAVLAVRPWVALDSASGFAFGGAALFIGALAAAELGAPPAIVFCAVGAALVVRDVGDHAAEVGLQIGRAAETRRGEVAHATGGLLVAVLGVGLAVGTLSFVGPVSLPTSSWRGYLALVLLLVAVVSFSLLLATDAEATDTR